MDELANGFNWLNTLGIPAAISGVFAFIGKRYLDKRLNEEKSYLEHVLNQKREIQKQQLKNSEFIFHKQYEASQELYLLRRSLLPEYRTPDMDWEDAMEFVSENLGISAEQLNGFLGKYFTVLSPNIVELLQKAINAAEEGQFFSDKPSFIAANAMYKSVEECSSLLKSEVDGQRRVEIKFSMKAK
ncbi:hypothetical protein [Shewanella vaxholmensis]|uniref:Uncharacterized protein n=1 Tax=Shewanella vaxholmensis TaxID=3063535 RepID=A0ABU9UXU8_9GAMM